MSLDRLGAPSGRVSQTTSVDGHPAPPAILHRALSFWTRLHGVLSLELAGHFAGTGFDPALLFAAELDDLLTA
ncbi:TetR-like C-terminal domain-containing protein [Nonomuraea sp. NPDC005650]|uniref:TetR-like C-terminal domain-containing protein n=1 Tax=Nonomuraea sp. NPDC005650 TaxID=3157045 RepID=UPI0033B7957B